MFHSKNNSLLLERMKRTSIQHKKERKVAIFVHGWFANSLTCWGFLGKAIIPAMFESIGYEVRFVDMLGMYMLPNKGFKYYAEFLAEKIREISVCPLCGSDCLIPREIILIAHSMGGVACRLYLQDDSIGDKGIKSRVKKLITIASPHHGTNPKIENIPENIINGFIYALEESGEKIDFEYKDLHWSKCYQELSIGSYFVSNLNKMPFPKQVEFHSIWSRGDCTVDPIHTAVSDYAQNHFIDKIYVTHLNILSSVHTLDILFEILNDKSVPIGLQKYPNECDCGVANKQWIPTSFSYENNLWKCINTRTFEKNGEIHTETCPEKHIQKYRPGIVGCDVGLMKQRFHTWVVTGNKHWTCQKCGATAEGRKFPKSYDKNGCRTPFHNWHRWKLVGSDWKCKNCSEPATSFWMPPSLGCEEGIYHGKRLHEWEKTHKIYKFNFKCTGCKKVTRIEVSLPLSK